MKMSSKIHNWGQEYWTWMQEVHFKTGSLPGFGSLPTKRRKWRDGVVIDRFRGQPCYYFAVSILTSSRVCVLNKPWRSWYHRDKNHLFLHIVFSVPVEEFHSLPKTALIQGSCSPVGFFLLHPCCSTGPRPYVPSPCTSGWSVRGASSVTCWPPLTTSACPKPSMLCWSAEVAGGCGRESPSISTCMSWATVPPPKGSSVDWGCSCWASSYLVWWNKKGRII